VKPCNGTGGTVFLFREKEVEVRRVRITAEARDFDPVALFGRREAPRNGCFALFALEAAGQAIAETPKGPAPCCEIPDERWLR